MENRNEYYIKRVEGALARRVSSINHQKAYLNRLKTLIEKEKNPFVKKDKVNRYDKELISLKEKELELDNFINIKMPKYFERNNVDYSMHILETI